VSDLEKKFEAATKQAKALPERPSDENLLKMYALYKQATSGDAEGSRPGMFDLVGRAKFDAWAEQKGTSKEAAMKAYVKLVDSLK
jgi:diazepam-binding inhibitor (GABA receptor modulating acyl-CoA-binding protein)